MAGACAPPTCALPQNIFIDGGGLCSSHLRIAAKHSQTG